MCGIVGYVGTRSAVPVLLDGLGRLEYRGYDSAGVSVVSEKGIEFLKARGKLSVLSNMLEDNPINGKVGIGHTRWATHGPPSDINAHPHNDCNNLISLVHNGIIENYLQLKEKLQAKGHHFRSETDTEVLIHLIEDYYDGTLKEAVTRALREVEGSYAVGVISAMEPDKIVAARQDSPLVVGLGKTENFIASDIPAFLPFTRNVQHVNDREVVVIDREGSSFYDLDGNPVQREVTRVLWDASMAAKGGYKHFMLKEIFEQPRVIDDVLTGRLMDDGILIEEMNLSDRDFRNVNRIMITACGTAFHAGLLGKYFLEKFTGLPVEAEIASELRYREPIIDENTLKIAVSQSGETADTLAAFKEGICSGAKAIAITNVMGSSITRQTDNLIYTRAGLEIGVAATKTFTAQVVALILLALKMGMAVGKVSDEQYKQIRKKLQELPSQLEEILEKYEEIRCIARKYYKCRDFLFLGRNLSYPVALEGALKLKEISYIHAEGYAAGEMKHGPIALIDEMMPVVSILPQGPVYDKILSNVKEVRARKGITIGVVYDGSENLQEYLDEVITVPPTDFLLSPVLTTIPLQLLAYFIAEKKDRDVDQPRNLAKSVTVE